MYNFQKFIYQLLIFKMLCFHMHIFRQNDKNCVLYFYINIFNFFVYFDFGIKYVTEEIWLMTAILVLFYMKWGDCI